MATGFTTGDLLPVLAGTVMDGATAVNLTTATTVTAHIRRPDGTVISRAVTLGNQTSAPGTWTMPWQDGDLNTAGGCLMEIEVVWPGAKPQTFGPESFQVARQIA